MSDWENEWESENGCIIRWMDGFVSESSERQMNDHNKWNLNECVNK